MSPSLISKIENNESGCDLKITSLIPFDHLAQLCRALTKNESTERLDLEGCGRTDRLFVLTRHEFIRHVQHGLHFRVLQSPHSLVSFAGVGDKGCVLIKDLLMGNKVIKHVDLQMNQITDVGCRSIPPPLTACLRALECLCSYQVCEG